LKKIIETIKFCMDNKRIPVIAGPTASGKSDLAYSLAERFEIEIISADSRQIYKYLDIGTAKPSVDILKKISHKLISVINPDERYSAAQFAETASLYISEIFCKKRLPVIVGGTGLYIKALFDGMFECPEKNDDLRRALEKKSNSELFDYLNKIDPESCVKININDKKRIVRAIEVFETTGESISKLKTATSPATEFKPFYFIMERDRKDLYNRINCRAEKMIKNGWIEETQNILNMGFQKNCPAFEGLGYKDIIEYLDKKQELPQTIENIKMFTRRYAKRQMIWFRGQVKPDIILTL